MLTVAINSSTPQTAVALISDEKSGAKQLLSEKSWPSNRNEAEKIVPAIFALLKKSRAQWSDVKKVFVINGPGPFTGMRVGVTIANAIAWATKSKIQTATVDELFRVKNKSFGEAALHLLKKSGGRAAVADGVLGEAGSCKTTKLAKPLYLKKPHITTSKKPIFT